MTDITLVRHEQGYLPEDSNCQGCRGCHRAVQPLLLPEHGSEQLTLRLDLKNQLQLLVHSWLMPLLWVVTTAIFCKFFGLTESWSMLAVVTAFGVAVACCRVMPRDVVQILE